MKSCFNSKNADVKNNIETNLIKNCAKPNLIKNDIETNFIIKADELKKETDINHINKINEDNRINNINAKIQLNSIMSILNDLVKSKYIYNDICLVSLSTTSNDLLDETIKLLKDNGYKVNRYFYYRTYRKLPDNFINDIFDYNGNIYLLNDYTQRTTKYFNNTSYNYYKITW